MQNLINWDVYKSDIVNFYCVDGLSSLGVLDKLVEKYGNIFPRSSDRHVRKVVTKWGLIKGQAPLNIYKDSSPAKILIFDIETAPISGYVWRLWKQNVGTNQIISDWFILTWSAKWLFSDNVMSDKISGEEVLKEDDKRICQSLWMLIEEADIIIAHNALKFDIPMINTRFVIHGMNPPMSYEVIDTLRHAQKRWKMSSNRLDYLCQVLGLNRKADTGGFELWSRCLQGDESALSDMEKYNIQDVFILEELYLRMRAWIKPHPNMNLHILEDVHACPTCGNSDLDWSGEYRTSTNIYEAFRCNTCGSQGRSRKAEKLLKSNFPVSVAK